AGTSGGGGVNYRNRDLLDCAYNFPCLLQFPGICEGGAGEPAHSNQYLHGKGGAMKAHDCYHVPPAGDAIGSLTRARR
ncbi:MAG TPA: hypothetical protein VIN36_10400, partial [Thiobacillus sp.]